MTTKVKAHPRKGTRGVREHLRHEPLTFRYDTPVNWDDVERVEWDQLKRMRANDESPATREVVLPEGYWEQREADRQRRRLLDLPEAR